MTPPKPYPSYPYGRQLPTPGTLSPYPPLSPVGEIIVRNAGPNDTGAHSGNSQFLFVSQQEPQGIIVKESMEINDPY